MRKFKLFIFYFIYLLAAELPFFLLLWTRNLDDENLLLVISLLLLASLIINICLFWLLDKNIRIDEIKTQSSEENFIISHNKLGEGLNNFFAIFLIPFFTFNFSENSSKGLLLIEIFIIFLLLTIFLYRTNNILSNIFIYLLFNVFYGEKVGENIVIISTDNKHDLESNEVKLVNIFENFYLFSSNFNKLKRSLKLIRLMFILLLIFTMFISLSIRYDIRIFNMVL